MHYQRETCVCQAAGKRDWCESDRRDRVRQASLGAATRMFAVSYSHWEYSPRMCLLVRSARSMCSTGLHR